MQEEKMSRQEAIKRRNQASKRYNVVLTHPEGEQLSQIIADHKCDNLSQLCKKIVHGEVQLRTVKQKIPNPD